jgi:NTP pyrophosphatase (non-canonical NTP hydrolase)
VISLRQEELHDWEIKNFGEQDISLRILGMAEELGEVSHHVLKGIQKIRGGVNGIDKNEVADGIADIFIYGINALSQLGINAEEIIQKTIEDILRRDWTKDPTGKGYGKPIQGKEEA